jgi:hypothetical protein
MEQNSVDTPFWANDQQKYWEDIRNIIAVLDNELYTETIVTITPTETTYSDGRPLVSSGILAMGDTPIELLPILPNGYFYQGMIKLYYDGSDAKYTIDNLLLRMNTPENDEGLYISPAILSNPNFNTLCVPFPLGNAFRGDSLVRLVLEAPDGNPIDGDGTLRAKIYYKIIEAG